MQSIILQRKRLINYRKNAGLFFGRHIMQRIAIIDIGSNSARLVISHIYKSGAYNMVFNQKEMLRLAQKTDRDGLLSKEAFDSTLQIMQSFAYMCRQYKTDKIIAVANGEKTQNEKNGYREISIFKNGVTL